MSCLEVVLGIEPQNGISSTSRFQIVKKLNSYNSFQDGMTIIRLLYALFIYFHVFLAYNLLNTLISSVITESNSEFSCMWYSYIKLYVLQIVHIKYLLQIHDKNLNITNWSSTSWSQHTKSC